MPRLISVLSFFPRLGDSRPTRLVYLITQDVASSLLQYIPPMYRNRTRTVPLQKKNIFITPVNNVAYQ